MNIITKKINISLITITSFCIISFHPNNHYAFSSTTSVSSQNGFSAPQNGKPTKQRSTRDLKKNTQTKSSSDISSSPLSAHQAEWTLFQILLHQYKNIVNSLIDKNKIDPHSLNAALESEDYFLIAALSSHNSLESYIFREALIKIKNSIQDQNNLAPQWIHEIQQFLTLKIKESENTLEILNKSKNETKNVFLPKVISKKSKYKEIRGTPTFTTLTNGKEIVLFGTKDPYIYFMDINTKKEVFPPFEINAELIGAPVIATLNNGKKIAVAGSKSYNVYFIDLETGLRHHPPYRTQGSILTTPKIVRLKNGNQIALFKSADQHLYFINTETGQNEFEPIQIRYEGNFPITISHLSNGDQVAILPSIEKNIYFINLETGQILDKFETLQISNYVLTTTKLKNGKNTAIAVSSNILYFIDIDTREEIKNIPLLGDINLTQYFLSHLKNGKQILTVISSKKIAFFIDLENFNELCIGCVYKFITMITDEKNIALFMDFENKPLFVDMESYIEVFPFLKLDKQISVKPIQTPLKDGRNVLILGTENGTLYFIDTTTGREISPPLQINSNISSLSIIKGHLNEDILMVSTKNGNLRFISLYSMPTL